MRVIKVGGNELADGEFLSGFADAIKNLGEPAVIVHGGGRAITELSTKMGIQILRVDGLRVTSGKSMQITEMVLSGQTNKVVVKALLAAGLNAVGISGVDGRLLTAEKKIHPVHDLGYVGTIVEADVAVIDVLIAAGITPVVSPVSFGRDGHTYNVNADEAATAVAAGLGADQLDFISNVPGVMQDGVVLPSLTHGEVETLIDESVIVGGMIPKVKSALAAVDAGVQARITNLRGLQVGGGTVFSTAEAQRTQKFKNEV